MTRDEMRANQQDVDFELLQTIASLCGASDVPAPIAEVGRAYRISRQAAHQKVKRLRRKGWVEENEPGRHAWGVRLTHNGKLLVETGLGAERGL